LARHSYTVVFADDTPALESDHITTEAGGCWVRVEERDPEKNRQEFYPWRRIMLVSDVAPKRSEARDTRDKFGQRGSGWSKPEGAAGP
jgi:hypothetical protein